MKNKVRAYFKLFKKLLNKRSPLEKTLLLFMILFILYTIINTTLAPLSEMYSNQGAKYRKTERDLKSLPNNIEKLLKLQQKKSNIENQYAKVEIKEGVLSHLEDLIQNTAKIKNDSDFKIIEKGSRRFSNSYKQNSYNIEFKITDLTVLKNFLEKLVTGKKPLLLSNIQLTKNNRQKNLQVKITVSSLVKQ